MTKNSELNPRNYRRIFWINIILVIPLLWLFAWPYIVFSRVLSIAPAIFYPGALLFAGPFMLTILHGHVDLALGSAHRHHYYDWLENHALTYGLLFHRVFTSTRFRLAIFAISVLLFLVGWATNF